MRHRPRRRARVRFAAISMRPAAAGGGSRCSTARSWSHALFCAHALLTVTAALEQLHGPAECGVPVFSAAEAGQYERWSGVRGGRGPAVVGRAAAGPDGALGPPGQRPAGHRVSHHAAQPALERGGQRGAGRQPAGRHLHRPGGNGVGHRPHRTAHQGTGLRRRARLCGRTAGARPGRRRVQNRHRRVQRGRLRRLDGAGTPPPQHDRPLRAPGPGRGHRHGPQGRAGAQRLRTPRRSLGGVCRQHAVRRALRRRRCGVGALAARRAGPGAGAPGAPPQPRAARGRRAAGLRRLRRRYGAHVHHRPTPGPAPRGETAQRRHVQAAAGRRRVRP